MRLIDADALLKQPLDKANYPSNYVREAPTVCDIEQIRAEIEAIDTVKVKHGDCMNIIKSPQRIKDEVFEIIDKYRKGEKG